MRVVYETNREVDLQMAKGLLEENGIQCNITADGVGDYMRVLGAGYGLVGKILVNDNDFENAKEILDSANFNNKSTRVESPKEGLIHKMILATILIVAVGVVITMLACGLE